MCVCPFGVVKSPIESDPERRIDDVVLLVNSGGRYGDWGGMIGTSELLRR